MNEHVLARLGIVNSASGSRGTGKTAAGTVRAFARMAVENGVRRLVLLSGEDGAALSAEGVPSEL